jgi:hypothetical protein
VRKNKCAKIFFKKRQDEKEPQQQQQNIDLIIGGAHNHKFPITPP